MYTYKMYASESLAYKGVDACIDSIEYIDTAMHGWGFFISRMFIVRQCRDGHDPRDRLTLTFDL